MQSTAKFRLSNQAFTQAAWKRTSKIGSIRFSLIETPVSGPPRVRRRAPCARPVVSRWALAPLHALIAKPKMALDREVSRAPACAVRADWDISTRLNQRPATTTNVRRAPKVLLATPLASTEARSSSNQVVSHLPTTSMQPVTCYRVLVPCCRML